MRWVISMLRCPSHWAISVIGIPLASAVEAKQWRSRARKHISGQINRLSPPGPGASR